MSREGGPAGPRFPLLEHVTAALLVVVLAALGWVLLAATWPDGPGSPTEAQVVGLLALLSAALVLVSVVALLHTR